MKLRNKDTGDIDDFYIEDDINVDTGEHWVSVIRTHKSLVMNNSWHFRTLKELYGSFEDYIPKEPLIKDEKIRKAVRAWAEALGVERASYSCIDGEFYSGDNCIRLGMVNRPEPIKSDTYTITELCGEEE